MTATKTLNILVLGSGGREHAIVRACQQSELTASIWNAPGSDAIAACAQILAIDPADKPALIDAVTTNNINFVIIGPEAYLVDGTGDHLRRAGIPVLGPNADAAQLEGSKTFSKQFMDRHGIPTARWSHHTSYDEAINELETWEHPPVIKADGLAAGKGVFVPESMDEARAALAEILVDQQFGDAGAQVLMEERLLGEEVSLIALTDGTTIQCFPPAQDHKRIFDFDQGPNTGGMGAYAPTTLVDDTLATRIDEQVVQKFVAGLQADNMAYNGLIYFGLMICDGEPYVLEFNARFGDPECQILLAGLDSDFVTSAYAAATGDLANHSLTWTTDSLCIVVAASQGYPQSSSKGDCIQGPLDNANDDGPLVIHAGTKIHDGQWTTNGGRVLGVIGRGSTIATAISNAYDGIDQINFDGMQTRKDIGQRELQRWQLANQ